MMKDLIYAVEANGTLFAAFKDAVDADEYLEAMRERRPTDELTISIGGAVYTRWIAESC